MPLFGQKATSRFAHKVAMQPVVPAGTRRFLCELSFAPFVSKESGVPNCALQNRCKPTEIKLSKPIVHFFFLKPKAQKEKVRKKKNAVWGVSLTAVSDKACAALTRTHWRGGSYGCGANISVALRKMSAQHLHFSCNCFVRADGVAVPSRLR